MAKIRTYDNTQNIDPSSLSYAASGAARAGQHAAGNIRQVTNQAQSTVRHVEKAVEQRETTKLAADFAMAQAELTEQWRQTMANADPNDPDVAERFQNEVVKPRLDKMGEGLITIGAQSMFDKASASMFGDMFVKTAADQAELAAQASAANLTTMMNGLSQAVRTDPLGWQNSVALANAALDGMEHIPADAKIKMRAAINTQIADAAARGMAKENPDGAIAALNGGEFNEFLDASQVSALVSHAESVKNAQEATAREQERQAEKEKKALSEAAETDITRRINRGEDISGFEDDPNLNGEQIRTLTRYLNAPDAQKSDPSTFGSIYQRVYTGAPVNEAEIRDQVVAQKLTRQDGDYLVGLLAGKKGADWNIVQQHLGQIDKTARQMIAKEDPITHLMDPKGAEAYLAWSGKMLAHYQQRVEAGERPAELMDPTSPKYILKQFPITAASPGERMVNTIEGMQTMGEDLQVRLNEMRNKNTPGQPEPEPPATGAPVIRIPLTQRQPGESPQAFITRRTQGGDVDMTQYYRDQPPYAEAGMDPTDYGRLRDAQYTHTQIMNMSPEARQRAARGE